MIQATGTTGLSKGIRSPRRGPDCTASKRTPAYVDFHTRCAECGQRPCQRVRSPCCPALVPNCSTQSRAPNLASIRRPSATTATARATLASCRSTPPGCLDSRPAASQNATCSTPAPASMSAPGSLAATSGGWGCTWEAVGAYNAANPPLRRASAERDYRQVAATSTAPQPMPRSASPTRPLPPIRSAGSWNLATHPACAPSPATKACGPRACRTC